VLLALLILLATWATIRWIGVRTAGGALTVGALWVALTLLFEFGAGHYAFGKSWTELLADYDLSRGRIWIVVLIATFIAPLLALRLRT
jgi:multisubunit Na+/H+ antiporter MnhB subunit